MNNWCFNEYITNVYLTTTDYVKTLRNFCFLYTAIFVFFIHFFRALSVLPSLFGVSAVVFRHLDVSGQLWLSALYTFNFACLGSGMLYGGSFLNGHLYAAIRHCISHPRHNRKPCGMQAWQYSTISKLHPLYSDLVEQNSRGRVLISLVLSR